MTAKTPVKVLVLGAQWHVQVAGLPNLSFGAARAAEQYVREISLYDRRKVSYTVVGKTENDNPSVLKFESDEYAPVSPADWVTATDRPDIPFDLVVVRMDNALGTRKGKEEEGNMPAEDDRVVDLVEKTSNKLLSTKGGRILLCGITPSFQTAIKKKVSSAVDSAEIGIWRAMWREKKVYTVRDNTDMLVPAAWEKLGTFPEPGNDVIIVVDVLATDLDKTQSGKTAEEDRFRRHVAEVFAENEVVTARHTELLTGMAANKTAMDTLVSRSEHETSIRALLDAIRTNKETLDTLVTGSSVQDRFGTVDSNIEFLSTQLRSLEDISTRNRSDLLTMNTAILANETAQTEATKRNAIMPTTNDLLVIIKQNQDSLKSLTDTFLQLRSASERQPTRQMRDADTVQNTLAMGLVVDLSRTLHSRMSEFEKYIKDLINDKSSPRYDNVEEESEEEGEGEEGEGEEYESDGDDNEAQTAV